MRSRLRFGLWALGILFVIILLWLSGGLRFLTSTTQWFTLPIVRVFSAGGAAVGSRMRASETLAMCTDRSAELEARLKTVAIDYVQLRSLEEENRSLRTLLKFFADSGFDHVSARVIARSTNPRQSQVLIDRGSTDGIETGMAVIVGDGIFVGKITSLQEHVATVTLVTDEQSRVAASLAGQHRLIGVIEGRGNRVSKLTLVPQSEAMTRDQVIVTSGTEEKVPANLSIGMTDDIEGLPTDPFKSAVIEPFARADQLDLLAVLRPTALRPVSERGSKL